MSVGLCQLWAGGAVAADAHFDILWVVKPVWVVKPERQQLAQPARATEFPC